MNDQSQELKIVTVFSSFHTIGNIPATLVLMIGMFDLVLLVMAGEARLLALLFCFALFYALNFLFKKDPKADKVFFRTVRQKPIMLVPTTKPLSRFIITQ